MRATRPFSVERFMLYRGHRLYGFRTEGPSKPGVIAAITSIIAERGLDITYYSTTGAARRGERGGGVFFIDFTDSDVEPEELAEELKALDFIDRVEIIRPRFEGFIVDDVSFPVMLGEERAIILSEPALRGFLIEFRRRLGSGGEAMLYHIGKAVGAEVVRFINHIAERIGVKGLRDRFTMSSMLLQSLGYGVVEMLDFSVDPPHLRVGVHRCIECELGRRFDEAVSKPYSHYVRGMIAGFASQLFDRDMIAIETRCIAQGDPHCELEVKPRE